jgi:hypothetical protein
MRWTSCRAARDDGGSTIRTALDAHDDAHDEAASSEDAVHSSRRADDHQRDRR